MSETTSPRRRPPANPEKRLSFLSSLAKRQFPLAPGLRLAVSADLVIDPHVIDDHLRREYRGLVRIAEELAADGHVHDEVERLVERSRPGVEVALSGSASEPLPPSAFCCSTRTTASGSAGRRPTSGSRPAPIRACKRGSRRSCLGGAGRSPCPRGRLPARLRRSEACRAPCSAPVRVPPSRRSHRRAASRRTSSRPGAASRVPARFPFRSAAWPGTRTCRTSC